MDERNELSDIILEKEDNKVLKIKRMLIIVALLILIFLVAIVVMKVINKPLDSNSNSKLILPPEPTIQKDVVQKDDSLFKQVPIAKNDAKKESFEDMVKSLKEKEIKKQKEVQAVTSQDIKPKEIIETAKKEIQKNIPKVAQTPKNIVKIKQKTAPVNTIKNNKFLATKGIYIQVGATSRLSPGKKFLKSITSKNYEYRLLKIQIKDKKVTKILIGPYANTIAAKKIIKDVKANINKDAFIYRVK